MRFFAFYISCFSQRFTFDLFPIVNSIVISSGFVFCLGLTSFPMIFLSGYNRELNVYLYSTTPLECHAPDIPFLHSAYLRSNEIGVSSGSFSNPISGSRSNTVPSDLGADTL